MSGLGFLKGNFWYKKHIQKVLIGKAFANKLICIRQIILEHKKDKYLQASYKAVFRSIQQRKFLCKISPANFIFSCPASNLKG